ncbi:MAG: RNA polymerase sigma factor [Bdellovibrionota bacterium]|jgi:RNA polymerase sigma-70 factor (ECF subfamily)
MDIKTEMDKRGSSCQETLSASDIAHQIELVLSGNNNAFAPLVNSYKDKIYNNILAQVGDPTLAEDLAQNTFVRAFKYLKSFRGDSSFYSWLTKIALNCVKDYFSSRGYQQAKRLKSLTSTPNDDSILEESSTNNFELTAELITSIRFYLSQLSEKNREVLILKFFEDLSYQEIADTLKIPIGTVSSRINHAILTLRSKMNNSTQEVS